MMSEAQHVAGAHVHRVNGLLAIYQGHHETAAMCLQSLRIRPRFRAERDRLERSLAAVSRCESQLRQFIFQRKLETALHGEHALAVA